MKHGFASATALLSLVLAACGPSSPRRPDPGTIQVTVSIRPQEYFVRRIGGDRVRVNVLLPPGASPATYEPKPAQIRALSRSAVFFRIGVPFEEAWLDRIAAANPAMRIVDTAASVPRVPMDSSRHGTPGTPDPHIWLAPSLVKLQAETIAGTLVEVDPDHAEDYRNGLRAFLGEIDDLDAEIRSRLAPVRNRAFLVFHPSWGYFAREYDLEMIPIEVGGREPSAAELVDLIRKARESGAGVLLVQPEFSMRAAETIARETGTRIVRVSPLDADWPEMLRRAAGAIASGGEPGQGKEGA